MNSVTNKRAADLMRSCSLGFAGHTAIDDAHACLAECHSMIDALLNERNVLLTKVPKDPSTGKWGMTRLWRAWMLSTAEWMAGNGATMPFFISKEGVYKRTRPFNANDAHELFSAMWLGTDNEGKRLSWAKQSTDGPIADRDQRFNAMQQHQIWMVERGIQHINPRDSEFQSLVDQMNGQGL